MLFFHRNLNHYPRPYLTYCAIKRIYFMPLNCLSCIMCERYEMMLNGIEHTEAYHTNTICYFRPTRINASSNMQKRKFKPNHTLSMTWVYCVCIKYGAFLFSFSVGSVHNSAAKDEESKQKLFGHIFQRCFNNRTSAK